MSDHDNDLDAIFGKDGEQPSGSALRKQLEELLLERKQLREELAKVTESERARTVESLFAKHSVPELAKDFFPKDAELTDESVTAFVERYGALWGAQAQQATSTPEEQAAANQVQQLSALGTPPPAQLMSPEALAQRLGEAKTKDDILRLTEEATRGYSVLME